MKKLLPILSLALILFGCKKSDKSDVQLEEKKYDVTFKVEDFYQEVVDLGKTSSKTSAVGDTLKNYADNLYYRIYNSAGVLVNSINQSSSSSSFGTLSDKLPSGNYNVVIAASKGEIGLSSGTSYTSLYYSSSAWNDLFIKKFTLTVASEGINQDVRLNRAVGGLEVTINDAIPTNANKITIIYQGEVGGVYFHDGSTAYGWSRTKDFALTEQDKGKTNYKLFMFVGNVTTPSSVVIRAYDASNVMISEKTVQNVRFYANKKTVLSGSLFPAATNPSIGFTVTVNPSWDVPTTPITF